MVRSPFVLALLGSSLTSGRLSGDWVPQLTEDLQTYPEAKGPIRVYNLGKGSQNSAWGVTQVPLIVGLKPTHILFEGFGINDCVDTGGGPAISRAQHIINIQDMINGFKAGIPGVDLTIQTMNPVSAAGAAIRPTLSDYYADEIATGTVESIGTINNYASWPAPLPNFLSYGAAIGYSAWGGAWNPADKNANVTLSGSNLVASSTVANCAVRSATAKSSGKQYFDVTIGSPTNACVGVMTAGSSIADGVWVGSNTGGIGYRADGNTYIGNSVANTKFETFTTGDVIGVCVDFTLLKVWFSKNGVWQNGDPVAGVGGFTINAATNYFPAFSGGNGATAGAGTANFSTVYPGDGLHPLWAGGVNTYLYPTIISYARARMAALWP